MAEAMTTEERWLAALKREQVDRLPFWPKIDASCAQHQIEPFRNMSVTDLHQWIGSDQHHISPQRERLQPSAGTAKAYAYGIRWSSPLSGVMTPLCKPETIREVGEFVKRYPVSSN